MSSGRAAAVVAAEEVVLGALISEPREAWPQVGERLEADHFTGGREKVAAITLRRLRAGEAVDPALVSDELRLNGVTNGVTTLPARLAAGIGVVGTLAPYLQSLEEARELRASGRVAGLPALRPASGLLDATFPPVEFAIDPYFPRAEVTELVGAHGIFKSTAALAACLCGASGRCWGPGITTQGRAVFITMEDSERTLARRCRAWLDSVPGGREREEAEAAIRSNFSYLARDHARDLALTTTDRATTLPRPQVLEHLTRVLAGANLVVLETASRLHDGPEMNEGLAVFAQAVETIAIGTGAAVCVVRHVSKAVARDGTSDSYSGRGGGSFSDAARSVLVMTRAKDDGGEDTSGAPLAPVRLVHAKATHTAPGPVILWRPVVSEHGVYLYALSGAEAARADARRLLEHLAALADGITSSDLHNRPPAGLRRQAAKDAIRELQQAGKVVATEEVRGRTKQRVTVYRLAAGTP